MEKLTINERISYLRKKILKLNQTDFANTIGMKQTGVSYLEQTGATVTEQAIKSICAIHNISEHWLRTGELPMFMQPDTISLDSFVDSRNGSEEEKEMLKEAIQLYFEFDPYVRQSLLNTYMKKVHPEPIKDNLFEGIPSEVEAYKMFKENKNNEKIKNKNSNT